ncbi:hypothetical protein KJ359_005348 [Pestalotiopsis sp. 9143b]|nr:hypothetical protein KJ359_005348 [Pestalotiopsis sp. 9143b]
MSSLLKQSISSPLEAGTSILDTQSLPPHLTEALEYASKRLARKAMHITLIVVRREHHLPSSGTSLTTATSSTTSSPASPEFSWSSGPLSPTRLASQGAAGLRHLVRRGTGGSVSSTSSSSSSASDASAPRSAVASPTFSSTPATPCTPATPYSVTTCTSTSSSSSSTSSSAASSAGGPNPWGARLIHATPLSPREEYHLRRAISKAERKFQTGTGFLAPASSSSASSPWSSSSTCGLYSRDVVRRCVRQNEVLFASEGLTLLGLDRLYAFKSALAAYARTTLRGWRKQDREARLEDAVDELRRLVLSRRGGGKQRLERKELYACYEWIGVSAGALGDVERMYRRAYGGAQQTGAFDEAVMADITVHVENSTHHKAGDDVPLKLSVARTPSQPVVKIGKPPSPKAHTPVLKLKTSFDTTAIQKPAAFRPKTANTQQGPTELAIKIDVLPEEEEDTNTARPKDTPAFWSGIDEMLTTKQRDEQVAMSPAIQRLRVSQQRLGPSTPNGYDDISPVTRGEWGFLFQGRGWTGGRTAAVETC